MNTSRKILISTVTIVILLSILCVILIVRFSSPVNNQTPLEKTTSKTKVEKNDDAIFQKNPYELTQTQFMFAKNNKSEGKSDIYIRPPGRDTSDKVFSVQGLISSNNYTRNQNNVAFNVNGSVYTSSDAGKAWKNIYSAPGGEEITSLRFSKHSSKLLVSTTHAYAPNIAPDKVGNTITSMELDGSKQESVLKVSDIGVFIRDWSDKTKLLLYQSGCNRCSQATQTIAIYNMKSKKTTRLPIEDGDALGAMLLDANGRSILYTSALHLPEIQIYNSLKNGYYGPPYSVFRYNISTKENKQILRLGKRIAAPKTLNDIPTSPQLGVAGTESGRQYYYVYDGEINLLYDDNHIEKLMKLPNQTRDILYVTHNQALLIIDDSKDWRLVSINPIEPEKQQTLFTTSSEDVPLGMSDQF